MRTKGEEEGPGSSHKGQKLQKWKVKDLNKAIDLWNQNEDLPPKDRLSMRAISRITGIAKTTLTERLTGRRKGEGKILGGARKGRVLTKGKPRGVRAG